MISGIDVLERVFGLRIGAVLCELERCIDDLVRLRVERQLGYKQAKYIMRIELVDSFANISGGKGGYWEDRGFNWHSGI